MMALEKARVESSITHNLFLHYDHNSDNRPENLIRNSELRVEDRHSLTLPHNANGYSLRT